MTDLELMVRNLSTASASLSVITDIHLDCCCAAALLRWVDDLRGDDRKRCIETLMVTVLKSSLYNK